MDRQNYKNIIANAEKQLLAIMLNSSSSAKEVLSYFKSNHLLDYNLKIVFEAIKTLIDNQSSVNLSSVSELLLKDNVLDKIGGIKYLSDIDIEYISNERLDEHTKIILEAFKARELRKIVNSSLNDLNTYQDIENIIYRIEEGILNLRAGDLKVTFVNLKAEIANVFKHIQVLGNNPNKFTGIESGFHKLDELTLGFQKSDLIVLASRPSMGKTAFSLNVAVNSALYSKKKVAVLSLEMPASQLMQRILGTISGVKSQLIKTGKNLSQDDWQNLKKTVESLEKTNIFIDDAANFDLQFLQNKLRKLHSEQNLDLVIIDYLQLISINSNQFASRVQEISTISRQLKLLARELNIPIICLSQLSRSVEKRENKRPIMSDLRDSGAIEQDADVVMFLYRKDYYLNKNEEGVEPDHKAELIISKHRNGPIGVIELTFADEYGSFENYSE